MTRTPSSSAFANFDPAPGPAATKSVFFETLDAAFPPAAMIASCAPSRVNPSSDPVATTVSREWFDQWEWTSMSRELDLRRAKRFAKAYARAGFPTRVIRQSAFLVNRVIVLELKPARKAVRR